MKAKKNKVIVWGEVVKEIKRNTKKPTESKVIVWGEVVKEIKK